MDLVPSKHAIASMASREITWAQVIDTVETADVVYDSRGNQMFQKGDIAVVTTRPLSDGVLLVITVLLRQTTQWSNDDARNRPSVQPEQVRRPVVQAKPRPPAFAPVPAPAFVPAPVPTPTPAVRAKHSK